MYTKKSGFTLVELILVLAIASIITAVAVPSFTSFVQNNRLTAGANTYISSINLARSEAIKRSARVVLCKSADGATCDTSSSGWQQGWLVFADVDRDNTFSSGDAVIRSYDGLSGKNILSGAASSTSYAASNNFITYNSSGNSVASKKMELLLCDARKNLLYSKGIRITASGRPNVVPGSELTSGLSC